MEQKEGKYPSSTWVLKKKLGQDGAGTGRMMAVCLSTILKRSLHVGDERENTKAWFCFKQSRR